MIHTLLGSSISFIILMQTALKQPLKIESFSLISIKKAEESINDYFRFLAYEIKSFMPSGKRAL